MRVCIVKSTGKLIESQSHATEGTLIKNALSMGYLASEIEEKVVTEGEFQAILSAQPKAPQPPTIEEQLAEQLAERDSQILKLKEEQILTIELVESNGLQQQELLELLIDMGVI